MRVAARPLGRPPQAMRRMAPASPPRPPGLTKVRAAGARALHAAQDPFHIALLILIVLNVSRVHQQFAVLKVMRPALIMTGVAFGLAFIRPGSLSRRPLLE